jgi:transposase
VVYINEMQVWDLFISGYTIREIAKINSCSESTIKRKIEKIKKMKRNTNELGIAKIFCLEEIECAEIIKVSSNRIYNKNEIIKMYLNGYKVKEISTEKNFDYYDVKNIIRNFRRQVGYEVFKERYEKVHNYNRESLRKRKKEEEYKKEILKTTGMDIRNIIGTKALLKVTNSQYKATSKAYVLTMEGRKTATWDLPRYVSEKV